MAASRSLTAMATWSISVSSGAVMGAPSSSFVSPEQGDPVLPHLGAEFGVVYAETGLRRQAQHADLALVEVPVHLGCGVTDVLQRVDGGEGREDLPLADQLVGVPRLPVVGEMGSLEGLELHPQVPVVVLDHVPGGGRAGHDGAPPLGREHRRPHGLASRMFEYDVDVLSDQTPDVLAQPAPF